MTTSSFPTFDPAAAPTEVLPAVDPAGPAPAELALPARLPRVNLLPLEVIAARRLTRVQHLLAAGLGLVVVGIAVASFVVHAGNAAAEEEVAAQQQRASTLHAQAARYTEVTTVDREIDTTSTQRSAAMANDVRWYQLLDAISRSAPAGIHLSNLSISLSTTGAGTTDPLAKPAIATITFDGTATTAAELPAWLDALTQVPGLSDARYSSAATSSSGGTLGTSTSTGRTTFSSTVGVTQAALSHRYDQGKG